jgi:hypothetical protein
MHFFILKKFDFASSLYLRRFLNILGVATSPSLVILFFYQSISSAAEYDVTLQKIFFTSKFSYLLSFNPSYETETIGQRTGEELLLIANHLDQSL